MLSLYLDENAFFLKKEAKKLFKIADVRTNTNLHYDHCWIFSFFVQFHVLIFPLEWKHDFGVCTASNAYTFFLFFLLLFPFQSTASVVPINGLIFAYIFDLDFFFLCRPLLLYYSHQICVYIQKRKINREQREKENGFSPLKIDLLLVSLSSLKIRFNEVE